MAMTLSAPPGRNAYLGFDYGLEVNDVFREWRIFMLPMRQNRSGHELRCEVVMCSNMATCQLGHGPAR